ncbi:MAG TPA: thiosulfate oxidation carrier protein SoxY [Alphaproteobacteria bacterium]|jgi:sulfur-oxidizing protein SoxY|nr:thiosulfate oxidation carrier protein SoxY [Alphaproteobacteria bacterium]HJP20699.1 thiosulfate oxidation carrier protein SoxY [Alphaproteobacteria bacterium]
MDAGEKSGLSRRGFFAAAGAGCLVAAGVSSPARADLAKMNATVVKEFGPGPYKQNKVHLKTPIIAENGRVVPIQVTVESPMTDSDYVKRVAVFVQENPNPDVAIFHFTPECGKAWIKTRCRMSKSSPVVAVAEMSDGSVHTTQSTVKVTIGGCGG